MPVVQSEPAVQDTEEDELLKQIMDKDKLPAAAQAVKKVQEAEDLHASPEGIGKLVEEARDKLTKLLPLVQKLHDSDVTAVEAAIDKARKREGITPDELAYLKGLARICKDSAVTTVTEELLRKMLGREKDWPEAKVEAPAPTPWWMEPWVWGTAGGLALVVALLVLLQRRKNSQAPDVQEDPAPVKEVGDSRTEVVVARPVLADPAAGTPALIRIDDLESGKGWEITHEMVTVGRNKQNDIRIADASVSSHHCTIQRQRGGSWTITDVGSANGVYINKRLVKHTELQSGDVFQLGRVSLRITIL